MTADDVARLLAGQHFNRVQGRKPDDLKDRWVNSERFVLMDIPTEIAKPATEVVEGAKTASTGPIVVDLNKTGVGRHKGAFGAPADVLILDGKHRHAESLRAGQKTIQAFVGVKAVPLVEAAIRQRQEHADAVGKAVRAFAEKADGTALRALRHLLPQEEVDRIRQTRKDLAAGKPVPPEVMKDYPDLQAKDAPTAADQGKPAAADNPLLERYRKMHAAAAAELQRAFPHGRPEGSMGRGYDDRLRHVEEYAAKIAELGGDVPEPPSKASPQRKEESPAEQPEPPRKTAAKASGPKVDVSSPADLATAIGQVAQGMPDWYGNPHDPERNWGSHKVLISDLYDALKPRLGDTTLDEFKEGLLKAHPRNLELSRLDMVEGLDRRGQEGREAGQRSEIRHPGGIATFHLVNVQPLIKAAAADQGDTQPAATPPPQPQTSALTPAQRSARLAEIGFVVNTGRANPDTEAKVMEAVGAGDMADVPRKLKAATDDVLQQVYRLVAADPGAPATMRQPQTSASVQAVTPVQRSAADLAREREEEFARERGKFRDGISEEIRAQNQKPLDSAPTSNTIGATAATEPAGSSGETRKMKRPWEMTRDEYRQALDSFVKANGFPDYAARKAAGFTGSHQDDILAAVRAGEPVPQEIVDTLAPVIEAMARQQIKQQHGADYMDRLRAMAAHPVSSVFHDAGGGKLTVHRQQTGPRDFREHAKGEIVIIGGEPKIVTKAGKGRVAKHDGETTGYVQDIAVRDPKPSEQEAARRAVAAHRALHIDDGAPQNESYPDLKKRQMAAHAAAVQAALGGDA